MNDQVDDFTLADETGTPRALSELLEGAPGGMRTQRKTFVIDTDRRVLGVVASEKSMTTHADEALAILRRREAA